MQSALQEGAIFAGRYRVVRPIAAGGMGAVYEVVHLDTGRRRALKVMLPHVLQSEELRERFKREARVAADVESEFIVDVFDAGVDPATDMPFMAMELLRGEELGKRLKRAGRLMPAEALTYLHQIALALDKTHRASIVHRDLKPENIFLTFREDGPPRVKILDFGVAKLVAEGVTAAGATEVVGTPTYMAPEQFRTGGPMAPAVDIYALGLMAYTLLVGVPYWRDEATSGNAFAIALVAVRGPAEPASSRAARRGVTLPPAFDAWFSRVTAVDPRHRPPTATAAIRALAEALGLGLAASCTELPAVRPEMGEPPPPSLQSGAPPMPSMAVPALSATLRQPTGGAFTRPGVAIAALTLGSLLGLAGGVFAWQRMRTTPTEAPVPAATTTIIAPSAAPPAQSTTPAPPPTETAAPPPTTSASAAASASASATAGSASAAPSAARVPRNPGGKPAGKLPSTPVYSQE